LKTSQSESALNLSITFVTPYFYPYVGGVQKCVSRLSEKLSELGCRVGIVSSDYSPSWSNLSYPCDGSIRLKRLKCVGRVNETPLIPDLYAEIRNSNTDIIHVNGMYPLFTDVALLSARRSRKWTVLNYHFDPVVSNSCLSPIGQVYARMAVPFVNMADIIVATGHSYAATSKILSSTQREISAIPNGVDNSFLQVPPRSKVQELRSKLGIDDKQKIILFVGQLKRFKGLDTLIRAFKTIYKATDSKLLIVGKGPEENTLGGLTSRLELSDRVVFAGFVSDDELPLYYHLSDVYALPSVLRVENFGITLLEAMAAGKPVVSSNLPGPDEVVDDGINGLLSKPGCAGSLAKAIFELLNDEKRARIMGQNGKLKAMKYTWDKIAALFLSVYRQASECEGVGVSRRSAIQLDRIGDSIVADVADQNIAHAKRSIPRRRL
jgi:phosphatidylinositol alpha-mannosyltransferase